MLLSSLFPLAALISGVHANPVHVAKRAVPRLGGVNLAGCEFGIQTDGSSGTAYCPPASQITHFASVGANLYRLPFGWQYMVSYKQASTSLDSNFFAQYDALVQAGLNTGGYVMLDLHNYARWNGAIVGQGGPSDGDLASLWKLLAGKYKDNARVIFGIMNEPHDLDVGKWATTVQASVNAIRAAGAKSQLIALPGTFWSHPDSYTNGENAPILKITDPAGDGSLLILDVHQYLDDNGSGQSRECSTNAVNKLSSMTSFLRNNKRRAILSETGGGNTASCQTNLGQELAYVSANSDVWVGFAAWSAGSFNSGYELSITPVNGQDNALFKQAIQPYLPGNTAVTPSSSAAPPPPASSSSSSIIRSSSASSSPRPPASSSSSSSMISSSRPSASTSHDPIYPSSVSSKSISTSSASASASASASSKTQSPIPNPSSPVTSGNLQKFTGALGGIAAPAVTKTGNTYTSGSRSFNSLGDALQGSCYMQMDLCQNAANQSGNKGSFTVQACESQQIQACLALAHS